MRALLWIALVVGGCTNWDDQCSKPVYIPVAAPVVDGGSQPPCMDVCRHNVNTVMLPWPGVESCGCSTDGPIVTDAGDKVIPCTCQGVAYCP